MHKKSLHVFVDTNVFIQCNALDALNWQELGDFDEVYLIVCRAVQAEIDVQKGLREGRKQRKARTAASILRKAIEEGETIIRSAHPIVTLSLRVDIKPTENLEGLDYRERDDQMIGAAHAYGLLHPSADVCVLSDDLGPIASAKMVGVNTFDIPESWLLQPESSDEGKEIKKLEAALAKATSNRPVFHIECRDANGVSISELRIASNRYSPMTDNEVSDVVQELTRRWPRETLDASEGALDSVTLPSGLSQEFRFIPPTEREIASYRDEKYPAWVTECSEFFRGYHLVLQEEEGWPAVGFTAWNDGTVPGRDVLVTLLAKGGVRLMLPPLKSEKKSAAKTLPVAPKPPRGGLRRGLDVLAPPEFLGAPSWLFNDRLAGILNAPAVGEPRRDPNGFYWKPKRPHGRVALIELECEQWRHGVNPEEFDALVHFDLSMQSASGVIECRIHAENLVDAALVVVPVRVEVTEMSTHNRAMDLVQQTGASK